ncbi:MAG: c-type cytochrome, partial [Sediminibacterium sp.]|nr:c-type cytochrome [Sediminibacterium sp.]
MKLLYHLIQKKSTRAAAFLLCMLIQQPLWAAGPPAPSEMSDPMAQLLVGIIVALLLVIVLLAYVVLGAAEMYLDRYKESRQAAKLIIGTMLLLGSSPLFAESTAAAEHVGKLSNTSLYALIGVIIVELGTIFYLLINLRSLLSKEKAVINSEAKPSFSFATWWDNINKFKPVQEESNIDLGHDYDGIRELDNRLPPWWLYGFYACIVFAVIYLYRFHISHSAPSSGEEYQLAVTQAAADKEAYLAKAANKVDENTVVYQSSADYLAGGQKIFTTACAPCHLADGGGSVGPNLTDDYWLHGGTIKDIFKTIKYGYPEKGMKSWQDDYTPAQIAQLASFVKSLHGT